MAVMRGELELATALGVVPVKGGGQGCGLFWLEVGVADIAVTVANKVVHDRHHIGGGPGITLIQIGRAHLARQAKFDVPWRRFCNAPGGKVPGSVLSRLALVLKRAASLVWFIIDMPALVGLLFWLAAMHLPGTRVYPLVTPPSWWSIAGWIFSHSPNSARRLRWPSLILMKVYGDMPPVPEAGHQSFSV